MPCAKSWRRPPSLGCRRTPLAVRAAEARLGGARIRPRPPLRRGRQAVQRAAVQGAVSAVAAVRRRTCSGTPTRRCWWTSSTEAGVGRVHRPLASVPAPRPPGRRRLSGVLHHSRPALPLQRWQKRGRPSGNHRLHPRLDSLFLSPWLPPREGQRRGRVRTSRLSPWNE